MKKLLSISLCLLAAALVFASCEKKPVPDGKCELSAFALTSAIQGTIDASAKTITVVIPTSVTSTSFTPTFTATEFDVVTIGGTAVTSGETSVTITDGTKVAVSDEVSAMNTEYTIVVLANDEAVELVSVAFLASDNTLLEEDVTPDAIAAEMLVRVPGAAFRQELTLKVEAGSGDEIKVNNTVVESGSTIKVDTNFPIDITVTDAVAGKSQSFVLKVGKILQYVVNKLGTYAEGTMNDFTMTINPNDNMPYFAYTRKVGEEKNNGVSIAKWNGSAFELVGPSGIADNSSRSASKPQVAFAKDGSIYAKYLAGEVASKPTVKKLNGEWTLVGAAGNTPQNNNTSYGYPFFIHPANGQPSFFWCGNSKNTDTYRTMAFSTFGGESWAASAVTGTVPAYGSGSTASSGMYYGSSAVVGSDKVFIASSFNEFGYYVHEVNADGTLTTIVDNFLPADAPHGLPSNLQLKGGPDGSLYMLAAVRSGDGSMQVFSVDKDAKTLKAYGPGLPVAIASNGGISADFGFAVNPVDGLVIIAFDDSENFTFGYLDDNLQWAWFNETPVDAASAYFVEFDKNGIGYIAYFDSAKNIVLYKVALEEDIIPE